MGANVIEVSKAASGAVNSAIASLTGGGIVQLGPGTFAGDITWTQSNLELRGSGVDATILTGSVAIQTGAVKMNNLTIRATGKAFGLKLFTSGAGTPRNEFRNVVVGATSAVSGDGPTVGIWLDGAILTVFDHCTTQFNTGAGLYVNTTVGAFSTNVNSFRDCTFNGNGTYGVHLEQGGDGVAAMMLHHFVGGNIENNLLGDVLVDSNTLVRFEGIDFETSQAITSVVDIRTSNPAVIEYCNFVVTGSASSAKFFTMSGVEAGLVRYNRTSGFDAGAIGIFTDTCVQCQAYGNVTNADGAGRVINNRGSMWGVT
jgi:hypothetical protein